MMTVEQRAEQVEKIVEAFMPMRQWRDYLTPRECSQIAEGLRRLAAEFEATIQ